MTEAYKCPGMVKCYGHQNCVPQEQLCDGQRQCPQGDDEWYCDAPCPIGCRCNGLTYTCAKNNYTDIPREMSTKARKLDFGGNLLNVTSETFSAFTNMIQLIIAQNSLASLPSGAFSALANLRLLDLSSNKLTILVIHSFIGLRNLRTLYLNGNAIISVEPGAFVGLAKLPNLVMTGMALKTLRTGTFEGLEGLEYLDVSNNTIDTLENNVFAELESLEHLMIYDNRIQIFQKSDFVGLRQLVYMHSDDFMFCCFVSIKDGNCLPSQDELSSCEDLMENNILRSFLWILGMMALFGNVFVHAYRGRRQDRDRVPSILIRNLSSADLMMGVYMLAIASVDAYYRGVYIENAASWKTSVFCQVLGCLSSVASEASVLTLGAITIDRLNNILFPLSSNKLNPSSVRYVILAIWILAFLIGAIPLIPGSYFQGLYYARSGVCVSLYITSERTPGWEFSFAIFHGVNFLVFIFIFLAYGYMYNVIKSSGAVGADDQRKREMAAARKMTLIVATDFCCWIPINIMGMCYVHYQGYVLCHG